MKTDSCHHESNTGCGVADLRLRRWSERSSWLASAPSVALLVGLTISGGCSAPPERDIDVIATIGGEVVRYSHYEAFLTANANAESPLADPVHASLFDMFIDYRLLVTLAESHGAIDTTRSEPASATEVIEALIARESLGQRALEPADIEHFYRANLADFERPLQARVRQILVEDRSTGERALAALADGEEFAEVAARFSRGPNARNGGDQGIVTHSDLPDAFAEVIFDLEVGSISGMVPADYGYHIFQVLEHFAPGRLPLEEVASEIERRLIQDRADQLVEGFVAEAKERYNVEVFTHNLPFEYQGFFADENDQ